MARRQRYFVACEFNGYGWRNGDPDPEFRFIKAASPLDALGQFLNAKELKVKFEFYDYRAEVHVDANHYHDGKKPLLRRSKSVDYNDACSKPDCPHC